jgi:hypothetical protein
MTQHRQKDGQTDRQTDRQTDTHTTTPGLLVSLLAQPAVFALQRGETAREGLCAFERNTLS